MSEQPSAADTSLVQQTSPYGYAYWEWVAREDPAYARARIPLSELSVGEGKALAIKYREMVIIGILAFRGASQEGMLAHNFGPARSLLHGSAWESPWTLPRALPSLASARGNIPSWPCGTAWPHSGQSPGGLQVAHREKCV